jgi:hypothetical protein
MTENVSVLGSISKYMNTVIQKVESVDNLSNFKWRKMKSAFQEEVVFCKMAFRHRDLLLLYIDAHVPRFSVLVQYSHYTQNLLPSL